MTHKGDEHVTLVPYFAGSARQMLAQRDHWQGLGVDAPFALENVTLHIEKGQSYHDDPVLAARQLGWLWRYGWRRYQGHGRPVLDYEPETEGGGRSSWRWCQNRGHPEPWTMMVEAFVFAKGESVAWYNARNRDVCLNGAAQVTRPRDKDEPIADWHLERHMDYTDIWCIEPWQLEEENVEAFIETRKPVALWLRDSTKEQIEVAVEVARAVRREA